MFRRSGQEQTRRPGCGRSRRPGWGTQSCRRNCPAIFDRDPQRGPVPPLATNSALVCACSICMSSRPIVLPLHMMRVSMRNGSASQAHFPCAQSARRRSIETPRPVFAEAYFFLTRHGHPAFGSRTIVPAGGDHGVAQNARVHFVSFRVHEQLVSLRRCGKGQHGAGGVPVDKTARVVDDQQFAGMGRGETGDANCVSAISCRASCFSPSCLMLQILPVP